MDAAKPKNKGFFPAAREVLRTAKQLVGDFRDGYNQGRDAIEKLRALRRGGLASASGHPVAEIVHEDDIATAQFETFHRSRAARAAHDAGHSLTHFTFRVLAAGLE